MAEKLEPPAPVSQEELAKIKDGAARDLVEWAYEESRIAFTKAVEASKRCEEVAARVGIKARDERAKDDQITEKPENPEKGEKKSRA